MSRQLNGSSPEYVVSVEMRGEEVALLKRLLGWICEHHRDLAVYRRMGQKCLHFELAELARMAPVGYGIEQNAESSERRISPFGGCSA